MNKILEFIENNKMSSSMVADALNRTGHLKNVNPITSNNYVVGEVVAIYAYRKSNWITHKLLSNIETGKLVYIENIECEDNSLVGQLMCEYAFNCKKAKGIICNGTVRDVDELRDNNYPVWATGISPIICNKEPLFLNNFTHDLEDAIMVCDGTGCVVIKKEMQTDEMLSKLIFIKEREENWFSSLRKGLSTFEITC